MKFSTTRILLLVGCYSLGIDARQMHANIDYSRYLEQKDNVTDALQEWMDLYGPYASQKGLIPTSESRSADDTQEDHRQRFFMAQQLVGKLNAESKGAVFSTHSPFTLLTEQEFAEYVRNSYVAGDSKTRRLREAVKEENNTQGAIGESQSLDKKEPNQEAGNVNPSSFDFKALFRKWIMEMIGLKTEERERSIASFDFGDVTIQPDAVAPVVPYDPASVPEPAPVERFPFPFPWGPVSPTDAPEPAPVDPPVQPDTQPTEEPWGPVSPSYAPGPAPGPVSPTTEGVAAMTVDWATNTCMPPIQDQGRCGSCWAFASISAVETSQCLSQKSSIVIKYSENNLATCDQRNQGCNGGTPGYALDFIQQNGVCTETDDPYTGQGGFLGSCSSCNRVQTGMKGYTTLSGDADLVSALNQGPVIIALSGSNAAFKHYQSGPLTVAECPEYANIDHAVVAVGYNDNVIKIRNSWGPRWGVDGYVYIDRTPSSSEGTCGIYTYMKQVQF